MIKVRFHLGNGPHKGHWQVRHEDGWVEHFDPDRVVLVIRDPRLHNQRGGAQQIHDGGHKQVVAWIEARAVSVVREHDAEHLYEGAERCYYDPRVAPYWRDAEGCDIDGAKFPLAVTCGRQVFFRNTH